MNFTDHVKDFTTGQLLNMSRALKVALKDPSSRDHKVAKDYLKAVKAELALREAAKVAVPKTKAITLYTDYESLEVQLTTLRTVHHDDGCDDSTTTYYKATKPGGFRKMDRDDIRTALRDGFGRRCSHEHDCCGCYFGGAGGITVRRGALFFNTHYSRNV